MPYSEEDCLDALQQVADKLGQAPTQDEYDSLNLAPSSGTIADRCGTWGLALAKAGLEKEHRREYSRDNCLNAIQNAADILGEEPTIESYKDLNISPSVNTIQKICGSWSDAKEEAGVTDWGEKSPEEEADEFFDMLEDAEPER